MRRGYVEYDVLVNLHCVLANESKFKMNLCYPQDKMSFLELFYHILPTKDSLGNNEEIFISDIRSMLGFDVMHYLWYRKAGKAGKRHELCSD